MVKKTLILITMLCICSTALADKQLERSEILEIFTALTANPQKAWIQSGTINATHEEYRALQTTDVNQINARITQEVQAYQAKTDKSELTDELQAMKAEAIPFNVRYKLANEYTMNSNVTVRVDGEKFYWQIDVDSRADSVKPSPDMADNFMTEEFNLTCNEKRVFVWNGQGYINYFRPLNHATIEPERFPVNGPLTAGVIPWGYGPYSLEELTKAQSSATESGTEIHLTIDRANRQESFVLDSEKNYAVNQYSSVSNDGKTRVLVYGGYQSINGKWCPDTVLIEEFDTSTGQQKLLARDVWNFTSISDIKPTNSAFAVDYEYDAFIEDFCLGGEKPLQYRYSVPELPLLSSLIEQRLIFANAHNQNCATASLKYACDKLGSSCSFEDLSKIVHSGNTTLAAMQQFIERAGLESIAVKADIETLRGLDNYQVIIHLPGQKHFAVLHNIDDEYVRLVDLSSNKFFYRKKIDCFNSTWGGTALLIAKQPIQGKFAKLDNTKNIIGCCGESCTKLLQGGYTEYCTKIGCICSGAYEVHYTRYGCENAPSGSCSESSTLKYKGLPCVNDPYYCKCMVTGDWTLYYMQACN